MTRNAQALLVAAYLHRRSPAAAVAISIGPVSAGAGPRWTNWAADIKKPRKPAVSEAFENGGRGKD